MKQNKLYLIVFLVVGIFFSSCLDDKTGGKKSQAKQNLMASEKSEQTKPFSAKLLGGGSFDSSKFEGQRLLLGFFSFKHKDSLAMLKALMKLKPFEDQFNFKIYLVNIDYNQREGVEGFLKKGGIDFPVILEGADLALAERFKVEHEVSLVGLSAKHKPSFGVKRYAFAGMPDGESVFLDYLKERLSIKTYDKKLPQLGVYPKASDFNAVASGGKKFKLSDYLGKAVHLVFFSPKCPHCQNELKFLHNKIYPKYKDKGLEIIAISAVALKGGDKKLYDSFKYKWPIVEDPKREIRKLFSNERAVPENIIIDKQGKIRLHNTGYSKAKNKTYEMLYNHILGFKTPMLLSDKSYNGPETCEVCHQKVYASWAVSKHAIAWQTLEIKGETGNVDCVGCHTLGFNDPKGYMVIKNKRTGKDMVRVPPWFQNVSCENCHGIGGPHVTQKQDLMAKENLTKTCKACHTKKFSKDFNFDTAIQKVNHSDADKISGLSLDERIKLLKE